jgi:phosphate starvation-inducible protein PhoH and related proteins|tara:strand:+ start:459 stop:1187 length:729 start_codon:yes stop_codon:yes gene_type:complete
MAENQSAKHKKLSEEIRENIITRPKGPIKFQLQLNEEQKLGKDVILNNAITILSGKAGSGKTLLACQVALDMLFKKNVKQIVITRPTVSKEEIGFLPGDLHQKMEPWMQPIYANFYQLYNKEKVDKIIESGQVEIVPLAFMRGRTFLDSFIIVDEAQNCTNDQMEMITSRLGLRSKMVVCGDSQQVDLKYRGESGFKFLLSAAKKIKDMDSLTLLQNHRHPVVDSLLDAYMEFSETTNKTKK